MPEEERDIEQLKVILKYCDRLDEALERFGNDFDTFSDDHIFQDCCMLDLVQIGEAVNRLSETFIDTHPQIEWSKIYGLRCHLVHGYEMFDAEIAWDAIENEIPILRAFCEERGA